MLTEAVGSPAKPGGLRRAEAPFAPAASDSLELRDDYLDAVGGVLG